MSDDRSKNGQGEGTGESSWILPPGVPSGTVVELRTVISAGGLTAEVFEMLARLARGAEEGTALQRSCPKLRDCHVFHDGGQTCPVLSICTLNTALE